MTAPLHDLTRETIARLINACVRSESLYRQASRGIVDPMLRAELLQYSTQRQEFAVELEEVGDGVEHESIAETVDVSAAGSSQPAVDRARTLADCERAEIDTLDAYREALATELPYAVGGVVHSQFLAISRVQNRIHTLSETSADT